MRLLLWLFIIFASACNFDPRQKEAPSTSATLSETTEQGSKSAAGGKISGPSPDDVKKFFSLLKSDLPSTKAMLDKYPRLAESTEDGLGPIQQILSNHEHPFLMTEFGQLFEIIKNKSLLSELLKHGGPILASKGGYANGFTLLGWAANEVLPKNAIDDDGWLLNQLLDAAKARSSADRNLAEEMAREQGQDGRTPLQVLLKNQQIKGKGTRITNMAKSLIKAGAHITGPMASVDLVFKGDDLGQVTLLTWAVVNGYLDLAKSIISSRDGKKALEELNLDVYNALELFLTLYEVGTLAPYGREIAKFLIKAGLKVDDPDGFFKEEEGGKAAYDALVAEAATES